MKRKFYIHTLQNAYKKLRSIHYPLILCSKMSRIRFFSSANPGTHLLHHRNVDRYRAPIGGSDVRQPVKLLQGEGRQISVQAVEQRRQWLVHLSAKEVAITRCSNPIGPQISQWGAVFVLIGPMRIVFCSNRVPWQDNSRYWRDWGISTHLRRLAPGREGWVLAGGMQQEEGEATHRLNSPRRYSAVSTDVVTAPEQLPPPARAATWRSVEWRLQFVNESSKIVKFVKNTLQKMVLLAYTWV